MTTGVLRAEKRDDGFYFSNPGVVKLPIENVYQGGVSRARNPRMQNMLRMIGFGENLGTGFPTMVAAWEKKFHTLPKLEDNLQINFPELTFSGMKSIGEPKAKSIGKSIGKGIGKTAGKVVDVVVKNPWITIPQIAIEVKTSEANVQKHITNLQNIGILKRVGGKKGGHCCLLFFYLLI
jgi:predicted HTH transcriptional regulator